MADAKAETARRPGPRRAPGAPAGPEAVRRAVLDTAARLFAEQGIDGVTLRDIARAADVHPALIGRYVGTRDELKRQVFDDLSTQLAAALVEKPLAAQGFARGTLMWTWTRVAGALAISGRSLTAMAEFNPVQALAATLQGAYGAEPRAARLRAAQITALALGWRLFEDYLVDAGELDDVPIEALRTELTRSARRLGATSWPSPPDPELVGTVVEQSYPGPGRAVSDPGGTEPVSRGPA